MDVESKLFRITQEAHTNSAKHARPTAIDIRWTLSSEAGILIIADNGHGFEFKGLTHPKRGSGLDLLTMRERAEFFRGKLSMESAPGQGTRITVEIQRQKIDKHFPEARVVN